MTAAEDRLTQTLRTLRKRVEVQQRVMDAMRSGLSQFGAKSPAVTIRPQLEMTKPGPAPVQPADIDAWPAIPRPDYGQSCPAGLDCHSLQDAPVATIAFAVFGLDGDTLEQALLKVSDRQRALMNFVPAFLTDTADFEPFRRRGFLFEYFPKRLYGTKDAGEAFVEKLKIIEKKWKIGALIDIGENGYMESRVGRDFIEQLSARLASGPTAPGESKADVCVPGADFQVILPATENGLSDFLVSVASLRKFCPGIPIRYVPIGRNGRKLVSAAEKLGVAKVEHDYAALDRLAGTLWPDRPKAWKNRIRLLAAFSGQSKRFAIVEPGTVLTSDVLTRIERSEAGENVIFSKANPGIRAFLSGFPATSDIITALAARTRDVAAPDIAVVTDEPLLDFVIDLANMNAVPIHEAFDEYTAATDFFGLGRKAYSSLDGEVYDGDGRQYALVQCAGLARNVDLADSIFGPLYRDYLRLGGFKTLQPIASKDKTAVGLDARFTRFRVGLGLKTAIEVVVTDQTETAKDRAVDSKRLIRLSLALGRATVAQPDGLVSCLMVTRNRLWQSKLAIRCYQRQTYTARELVIVDTTENKDLARWVAGLEDASINFVHFPGCVDSLGAIRNLSIQAARGRYLAQWDDDDLSHPARLEAQIGAMAATSAQVSVLRRELMWVPSRQLLAIQRDRAHENSLICEKAIMAPYPSLAMREDTPVVEALLATYRAVYLDQPELYVYVAHGTNTWDDEHMGGIWRSSTDRFWGPKYSEIFAELARCLPVRRYDAQLKRRSRQSGGAK